MSSVLSSKKNSLSEDQVKEFIGNPGVSGWTPKRGKVFKSWLAKAGVETRKALSKAKLEQLDKLSSSYGPGVNSALHYHLLHEVPGTPHDDILLDRENGRVVLKGGASS